MWKSSEYAKQYWRNYYFKNKKDIIEKRKIFRQKHQKRLNDISRDYHLTHKKEISESQKRWWNDHREENLTKLRKRSLKLRYGLTLEQVDEILIKQDHKCAICKIPLAETRRTIDHDHKTGKARGILCQTCNAGLGMFKENFGIFTEAIQYLKRNA